MRIPPTVWEDFRVEMEPYIKNAYEKRIPFEEFETVLQQKMNELREKYDKREELIGWLGGNYDDLGFYDSKEDAERGHHPSEKFYDLIGEEFKGKKVKIVIEVIEE